jgi:PAS domain S-box-containing protein
LQYLAIGITLSLSGALASNLAFPFLTGDSAHTYLGPYFLTPFVLLTAHSIIRHRLLDLRLVVRRGLTIAIATALSLIPVGLFLLLFRPLTTGPGWTESLGFLTALVAVTLLVPPTRDLAGHLLDRYLYRSRLGFAETVGQVSRALRRVFPLRALATVIGPPIRSATGAEGVVVFVRDEDGLLQAVGSCVDPASPMRPVDQLPSVVDAALTQSERLIADDDQSAADLPDEVRAFLRSHRIVVLQAVVFEDSVIGAIAVGPKLSGDPFYAHDLSLLTTLANQAGIAIKNAQLYTEVILANEYLTNVLATIESGVISINAAGRVLMINRAAEELTGLPAETVVGRPMADVLPDVLERPLRVARDTGERHTEPELALPAGETTRPVICTTSPVRDPSGEIIGAVSVFSDLTLLKELEAQRRRAERLAYFEVLAAGLAHEIKNPLVAIKAFTQLVPRRSRDDAFIEEFSRVVSREIGRMERVVDRLRVLSRPGARPRRRLDVRGPLRDALEFLGPVFEQKQLSVTVQLPAEPALTIGDDAELEQLFINLLMNAREATPSGGTVTVTLVEEAGVVRVAVADTGPGIPPALLSQVFEPFFTTKARGSGLGLAISSAIAESHGARIWAANREEGGAVFTVELPTPPPVEAPRPSMNPAA